MASIVRRAWSVVRKAASFAADLLPGPPSDESPPPDVDGRRASEPDLTRMKVDLEAKEGKGGYR
jgi:hypothetical protein